MSKDDPKALLKSLPIWEHVDKFRVEVRITQHELDNFIAKLDANDRRLSRLPKLETDKRSVKLLPPKNHQNDQDIVKIFRKVHGIYQVRNERNGGINDMGKKYVLERIHNTARKSTAARSESPRKVEINLDGEIVEENRDVEEFIEHLDMRHHKCSPSCLESEDVRTELSVSNLIDDFRGESDLKIPLILGWKRRLVKIVNKGIVIVYEAPCGKVFQRPWDLRRYIQRTNSKFDIDYFSFERDIEVNNRIGKLECLYFKNNIAVDAKTRKPLENKYICLINQINKERLPLDFEYRSVSFPHSMLKSKGFSFNEDFKSGCDCDNDCEQRASCPCHRLNEEAFKKSKKETGTVEEKCQYKYKRLTLQVGTGIFECNSFCKCSSKCSNRVVQNGIRFRLMVQKTVKKGWGVVTLDDIPPGAFICTYAAELLDDADMYGNCDMYYADLDYISVNEDTKMREFADDEKLDEGVDIDMDDNRNSKGRENRVRFKKIHELLGSHDFTLDARMQGNVGRFFNHSCDPNSIVQNVFIETHDLRFPTVAFFASRVIKASDEITWNYNYKIGSIENRNIFCHCGASNCRGRIL